MEAERMTQNRVSAVLTTYQRAELAKRALHSILGQTLTPAEIIVVEDAGHTDLAGWISALGRNEIKYVRHESNQGLAAARNTGLRVAQSELIAYLDDDDEWLPTRLEEQVDRYLSLSPDQRRTLAAIQVGCKIVNSQGRQVGLNLPLNQGNLRDSIIRQGAATPSSCFMFVRSALLKVNGFDEDLISGIDHDIWMKLAVAGYSNEIVKKPLVVITGDDRRTMMSDTKRRVAGIAQYVDKWTPTYKEWFGGEAGEIYARKYFLNVICCLAGQKFAQRRFRDGFFASNAAFQRARWRPDLLLLGTVRLLQTFLSSALHQLRVAKTRLSSSAGRIE